MNHIQEFQSANFHGAGERCFLVLVLLGLIGLSRRRVANRHLLLLLFAVYAGAIASRNIPIASILIAFVIGAPLTSLLREVNQSRPASNLFGRMSKMQDRVAETDATLRHGLWIALGVLVILCATFRGGRLGPVRMQALFEPTRFPVEAVDFMKSQGISDPVFSIDQWGGYLVFRLYPDKVMVDDRHDLYGSEFFQRYLKIVKVEPGWRQDLESMNTQLVLVPSNSSLAGGLENARGWGVEYHDETATLFRRSDN